jgi:hypothetical protein
VKYLRHVEVEPAALLAESAFQTNDTQSLGPVYSRGFALVVETPATRTAALRYLDRYFVEIADGHRGARLHTGQLEETSS